ncbi:MAG: SRPBCC family protein [Schleiferiaceae bacterium]|jgi:hypothetical protein|nr:SRPBCC family protein [Schleiferiaceae bacterium]
MSILSSKWMIAAMVLVAVLLILYIMGKKEVKTSVEINASSETVWNALKDAESIKAWNKVLIPEEGDYAEGNTIKYRFVQEGKKDQLMDASVLKIETGKLINQGGGVPGILTFNHSYIIEPSGNATRVTIHEKYRGIMVPFWNPASVETAYTKLLGQLKSYVENE